MKNILSSRTGSYDVLQRLGIKGVEVRPPAPEDVGKLKSELSKYGLTVMSVAGSIDLTSEDGIETFDGLLNGAISMGVKLIFASAKASDDIPREVTYERLRKIGDKAAAHGLTVCLETHPILCHNGDEALKTMEGVNHDSIRLNFDTANIYYYNEGTSAVDELKKVAEYVKSMHLKDTDGTPRSFVFPPLGEGIVDFPEVFRILNEVGFYGPFTFELESTKKEEMAQALEKSVNYLRSTGCVD
jgi:inosose dehydratase